MKKKDLRSWSIFTFLWNVHLQLLVNHMQITAEFSSKRSTSPLHVRDHGIRHVTEFPSAFPSVYRDQRYDHLYPLLINHMPASSWTLTQTHSFAVIQSEWEWICPCLFHLVRVHYGNSNSIIEAVYLLRLIQPFQLEQSTIVRSTLRFTQWDHAITSQILGQTSPSWKLRHLLTLQEDYRRVC